jgi:hypothetical protein
MKMYYFHSFHQDPEENEEELLDAPIEVNGLLSFVLQLCTTALCYFAEPLQPPHSVLSSIQHRETLENRLVDW